VSPKKLEDENPTLINAFLTVCSHIGLQPLTMVKTLMKFVALLWALCYSQQPDES